ncbi:uncharacterized protein LOC128267691 isoform X1 [Anopheles cruzii]|uniref:uncharacterized protein LOC128267691 isoform X1 n=1 Tax=Anopheles cruzii TaxID=68878 RepID=UPI0022EC190E|nr:uncharacterized protein LOC128267691 isoform X1 [Anopheles cruzii]
MRKTWIKRDNIYYKPFYKQKLKLTLISVLMLGVLFFVYQLVYISQLLPSGSTLASQMRIPLKALSNDDNPVASPELGRVDGTSSRQRAGGGSDDRRDWANGTVSNHRTSATGNSNQFAYVERIGNYERLILRGIRLRDLDRYTELPSGKFRCLKSGREIVWERVNDDYCDCTEDGSDEPGTNACERGKFYCRFQKRHSTGRGTDVSIPSSWVNDGVCDCCDGSDEWLLTMAEPSSGPCINTCKHTYFL